MVAGRLVLFAKRPTHPKKGLVSLGLFAKRPSRPTVGGMLSGYIASTHDVAVYMAEWDGSIKDPGSLTLPANIMQVIRASRGLLVYVIAQITHSMWIGYEVGGAHALRKP